MSAASNSANKVADLENGVKINVDRSHPKQTSLNSPTRNEWNFSPNHKTNEEVVKPNITAITTEQSVELHASLNELLNFSRDADSLSSPTKQEEIIISSQQSSPESQTSVSVASDNSGKNLEKNEARRQRRHLRKRDISNIKSSVSKDEKCIGSIDEQEAKILFPMPSLDDKSIVVATKAQEPISPLDCNSTTQPDSAWDENATSGLDTILEQSKTRYRSDVDGKPLLELDAVASDSGENDARIAAEKLLSQQQRINMYNSGKGFGVGEDSSVEFQENEDENDNNLDDQPEYQTVEDENDDDEAAYSQQDADTSIEFIDFGKGSHEEFSTEASSAAQTVQRAFDENSDAISDIDRGSDFFGDANSSTAGGGTVLGLRFLGSNDESLRSRPTPPGSPANIDCTPRIGNKDFTTQLKVVQEEAGATQNKPKLFKIAPPPPEKLRQWEESKRGVSALKPPLAAGLDSKTLIREVSTPKQEAYPITPKNSPPSVEKTPSLKISTPKSPSKKKPNSITEELNLSSHTKMAEKFAYASSKAAKKFEEKYSHIEHDIQYGPESKSPKRKGTNAGENGGGRFFCGGDSGISLIPSSNSKEKETNVINHSTLVGTAGPGAVELVGGAFSPWKIPDRAEEDSNASSSRVLYDDESFAKASAAALNAVRKPEPDSFILPPANDVKLTESVEVGLDWVNGGARVENEGLLSGVLEWLFRDVLPSNAFSAFDIKTSTSVQARRIVSTYMMGGFCFSSHFI